LDLGVPLLVRGLHGVKPTEAGERLYAYAVNILKYVDEAADRVRRLGAEPQGLVAVGPPTSVALVFAVPLVEAVCRELPQVAAQALLTEDLYVVCPPGARGGEISFAETAAFPLIVPGRSRGLRERLELGARPQGRCQLEHQGGGRRLA
jgi:LysR family nitrogen assimilation transcriptional regulator